jgi:hypothetical protein
MRRDKRASQNASHRYFSREAWTVAAGSSIRKKSR